MNETFAHSASPFSLRAPATASSSSIRPRRRCSWPWTASSPASPSSAEEHLARSRAAVENLAARLGLDIRAENANDPFYSQSGSRALLAKLHPVKHEFLASDGTAIASVNRHRNFFGHRLGIGRGGEPAASSCPAFGLERWIHALTRQHGSAEAALDRFRS